MVIFGSILLVLCVLIMFATVGYMLWFHRQGSKPEKFSDELEKELTEPLPPGKLFTSGKSRTKPKQKETN